MNERKYGLVGRSLRERRVALGRKLLPNFVRGKILKLRVPAVAERPPYQPAE